MIAGVNPNRVVIIDDHDVVRQGVKNAIQIEGFEVVAEARTLAEAYAQIAHTNPDAIIVDINLPDGSGLEIVKWARTNSSTIAIVVLTLNENTEYLVAAVQSGASALILKSSPIGELVAALKHAVHLPTHFSSHRAIAQLQVRHEKLAFTSRELQVLAVLDSESTNADLGRQLFISEATLKTHLSSIYRKLEVKNRVGAIKKAKSVGLL